MFQICSESLQITSKVFQMISKVVQIFPKRFKDGSIIFTDFQGFPKIIRGCSNTFPDIFRVFVKSAPEGLQTSSIDFPEMFWRLFRHDSEICQRGLRDFQNESETDQKCSRDSSKMNQRILNGFDQTNPPTPSRRRTCGTPGTRYPASKHPANSQQAQPARKLSNRISCFQMAPCP